MQVYGKKKKERDFPEPFNRACWIMCSELNLLKANITKPLAFPLAKSERLMERVWTHAALHFSLKRNVYLNQINIQRETSDLRSFAYKSCCLHSYAFPQGDTCFLFCLLQQRQGEKCIPVLKSNKSSQIKHPFPRLLHSPRK